MLIRPEQPHDFDEIDAVVAAAFKQPDEADLVRKIRTMDVYIPELTLVAIEDDHVVGHVMHSYATIGPRRVPQLAPLAVRPDRQNAKIGDALTREALTRADQRGEPLVLVLGHPSYYPRFGFEPARALGIEPEIADLPDDVWMAKKLSGYDPAIRGLATFMPGDAD
jgi:putative acetyltransferase